MLFLPESKRDASRKLDWFGFLTLALGLGALQMMLDRGERHDWFETAEILVEAGLAALGLYLFTVHSLTTKKPFLDPRLVKVPGFLLGLAFVSLYGLLTVPPMVLMPTFMQDLRGMPVDTIGLLQSPRGFGLILSMFLGGSLTHLVGARPLVLFGFCCLAAGGFALSHWNLLVIGEWPIVWVGFIQGVGAGIIWVPLQSIFFAALPVEKRTEAASVLNLVRSLMSAIGVSIALTMLTRSATTARSGLVEHVIPSGTGFRHGNATGWDLTTLEGLAQAQRQIDLQALSIGYSNDFLLIACGALLALPLLLFIPRLKKASVPATPAHAE
jgi:DHA2 family multidrug resistance protein